MNKNMYVRKATNSDISRIMEIYNHAREFMKRHGNPRQWAMHGWPPESLIRNDIQEGHSYVCVYSHSPNEECNTERRPDRKAADGGTAAFDAQNTDAASCDEEAKLYGNGNLSGQERNERIVGTFYYTSGQDIEPAYRSIEEGKWFDDSPYGVVHRIAADGTVQGTGAFCIGWALQQCGHLRIDTHPDNKVMQGLLAKLGFSLCGIIHVEEDDDPRFAYEKYSRKL